MDVVRLIRARRLNLRALTLDAAGRHAEGAAAAESALDLVPTRSDRGFRGVADRVWILLTIATIHAGEGSFDRTESAAREAVGLADAAPRSARRDEALAASLTRLGDCQRLCGRYSEAEVTLHRAALLAQTGRIRVETTLGVLNAQGILAKDQGDFGRASALYRRVLRGQAELYGAGAPESASLFHNLAGLALACHEPDLATALAQLAVTLRRAAARPDPDLIAADGSVLATALLASGDTDAAEAAATAALEHWRRARGPDHFEVAGQIHLLAVVAHRRGDDARAAALLHEAMRIKRSSFGDEHPDVASVAEDLQALRRVST